MSDQGIGLVLHVGAGGDVPLDQGFARDARDVVLLVSDPAAAEALRDRTRDDPRVRVWPLGVGARDMGAGISSGRGDPEEPPDPQAPTAALHHGQQSVATARQTGKGTPHTGAYAGRATEGDRRTAVPPDLSGMRATAGTLLAILPAPAPVPDLLILDATEDMVPLVAGLHAADALWRFRRILLRTPPPTALWRCLAEAGYHPLAQDARDSAAPPSTDPQGWTGMCLGRAVVEAIAMLARMETALGEARLDLAVARSTADRAAEVTRDPPSCADTDGRPRDGRTGQQNPASVVVLQRTLALRQAEIDDLRDRHAALVARIDHRDTLLRQLAAGLAEAAQQAAAEERAAGEAIDTTARLPSRARGQTSRKTSRKTPPR